MGVGENIRSARIRAKLTQKQLGELCGIAEPTIRRYELNSLNPKFDTIAKIAEALGVSVARLIAYKANDGYWTDKFRCHLREFLQTIDHTCVEDAGFDLEGAIDIAEGVIGFSFEDACAIADELGTSLDELLDWKAEHSPKKSKSDSSATSPESNKNPPQDPTP